MTTLGLRSGSVVRERLSRTGTQESPRIPRLLEARVMLPVSVLIALVSLAIVRAPTYDVWAWLVWGREVAHLDLVTTDGPQFKPLPVAVTALSAPLGDLAVPVWLVVARAAGLLALVGTARLAWRIAGWPAAILAALSLVTVHLFAVYLMPHGMSEPMLVACLFWAVDRQIANKPTSAFVLLVAAALLRVEAWPFLILAAIYWARRREVRPGVLLGGLLLVPAAWFLPEWWGSGNPLRSGNGHVVPGGPASEAHPGPAVLASTTDDLLLWVTIGAVLGLVWALWHRHRLLLGLTAGGLAWLLIVAAMAEVGASTGISRYLIPTHAVACLLAAVGWVNVVRFARDSSPIRGAGLVAAVLVALLAIPSLSTYRGWLRDGAREARHQQAVYESSSAAVAAAHGPAASKACGYYAWSTNYRVPDVAWLLHRHLVDVQSLAYPGRPVGDFPGVIVQIVDRPGDQLLPEPFTFLHYRELGRSVSHGVPSVVFTSC